MGLGKLNSSPKIPGKEGPEPWIQAWSGSHCLGHLHTFFRDKCPSRSLWRQILPDCSKCWEAVVLRSGGHVRPLPGQPTVRKEHGQHLLWVLSAGHSHLQAMLSGSWQLSGLEAADKWHLLGRRCSHSPLPPAGSAEPVPCIPCRGNRGHIFSLNNKQLDL